MKADISRDTFQTVRHIRRVVAQQGRPWLDADWNEQISVLLHRMETLAADMFGEYAGIGDGFKVETVTDDQGNPTLISVAPGRYYVHGLMCENYGLWAPSDLKFKETTSYLICIHAWEEYESGVEEPGISEPALRGIETAGRTRVRWRIESDVVTDIGTAPDEGKTAWEAFKRKRDAAPAILTLRVKAGPAAPDPSRVHGRAAYRGMNNTLYRVEVHAITQTTARLKWARDNGSTVLAVASHGSSLKSQTAGDLDRSIQSKGWVEVYQGAGQGSPAGESRLHQIETVDREAKIIHLTTAPAGGDNLLARPWLGSQEINLQETRQPWLPLGDGLEFSIDVLDGRQLRPGQYWTIPVRSEAGGQVYWPVQVDQDIVSRWVPLDEKLRGARGVAPQEPDLSTHERPSEGDAGLSKVHYYGPLALITSDGQAQLSIAKDLRQPHTRKVV